MAPLTVGERVQARIAELHTNSTEVASKAGLERTFVYDLISGRKKTVTAEALVLLAKALGCLPEELVGMAGDIERKSVSGRSSCSRPRFRRVGKTPPTLRH